MALWIDVTDLYHWGLGHLTGIQRTSASVLSELMAGRSDVRLFAFDLSAQTLREVDVRSLPRVVRHHIGLLESTAPGDLQVSAVVGAIQDLGDPHVHRILKDVVDDQGAT